MNFDWNLVLEILPALLSAFLVTVQASLLGMLVALLLGLVWALLRRSDSRLVAWSATWTVEFIRSTPLLVQVYFLFYVLPSFGLTWSPLVTGVIALGLHYSSYELMSKVNFDWNLVLEILPALLSAFLVTVQASLLGMLVALLLGLVWALLRRSDSRLVAWSATWTVEFIRSTPLLVQVYFLFYVLPSFGLTWSPLVTGVIALGLHYSSYTAEVYRTGIDNLPRGQWEAAMALNLGRWDTYKSVVLPQAIPPMIPALGNYLVAMFKETPVLAAITVGELLQTAKLIGAESFRYLEPLTIVGVLFLIASLLSTRLVEKLEARFVPTD